MRASWEKTDLGNGAAVCTAQASMWGTTQSVSYVVYPTTMFSTRVAVCDTPAKTSMIAKDKKSIVCYQWQLFYFRKSVYIYYGG